MKQFLTFALFILPIMLFSSNIDISKAKGTTQETIVQLMPYPQQEDVSRYIEISASFNIPLYAKHIKKFDVKLKYICENEKHEHKNRDKDDKKCKKKKNIKGEVRYIKSENRVTFRPSQALASGVYEVEYKSIKADKSHKHTKIKEIKYRFVVEEKVLESSTILPSNIHLIEGEISQLTITGKYDNGIEKDIISQVEWIVGDSQTISIDDKGLVTALKAGDTTIQAKLIGVVEAGEVVSNEVQVEVLIPDIVPPVITLNGEETIILHQDASYQELGAVAIDERDGEVNVTVIGAVDTTTVGSYIVIYTAIDSIGNEANITRNVTIIDVTPPTITLNGDANITLKQNENYTELGATAFDAVDGNISVEVNGEVDTSIVGEYNINYIAKDIAGNESIAIRIVSVVAPSSIISDELNSTLSQTTIPYNRITLEINATFTDSLFAINKTLSQEQNRTIRIKGVDNNGTFYLYNIPLIKGTNHIELNASNSEVKELLQTITINADANISLPIGMRATKYDGVKPLDTTVEVGTYLTVQEYLFDEDGDGIIDETHTPDDTNFTLNLTQEGRYKPRVTIRTEDNLLYSSSYYALSLDVKADANQSDPKGAEPIDVAKEFVEAIMSDDRERVEHLTGYNQKISYLIYSNPKATKFIKKIYSNITNWEQQYNSMGDASVKIEYEDNGTIYGGGFEIIPASMQRNTGRYLMIRFIY